MLSAQRHFVAPSGTKSAIVFAAAFLAVRFLDSRWLGSGFFAPDFVPDWVPDLVLDWADAELVPVAAAVAAHASAVTNSVAQSTPMAAAIASVFICINTLKISGDRARGRRAPWGGRYSRLFNNGTDIGFVVTARFAAVASDPVFSAGVNQTATSRASGRPSAFARRSTHQ